MNITTTCIKFPAECHLIMQTRTNYLVCLETIFSLEIKKLWENIHVAKSLNQSKFKTRNKNESCLKYL